jgi:hypothetical protein
MQSKQLSPQRPDGESKRLEYKSPTLRKLGNLTRVTLTVDTGSVPDTMPNMLKAT